MTKFFFRDFRFGTHSHAWIALWYVNNWRVELLLLHNSICNHTRREHRGQKKDQKRSHFFGELSYGDEKDVNFDWFRGRRERIKKSIDVSEITRSRDEVLLLHFTASITEENYFIQYVYFLLRYRPLKIGTTYYGRKGVNDYLSF